jgi:hypothetical protein
MSQDQAPQPGDARADDRADALAVVEWGDDEQPPGRAARGLARLRADHRLAPTVAGLGALALFFSLLNEWRVWTAGDDAPPQRVASGVVTFPSIGTAYLVGLFALAACATLALFGGGPVRHSSRLVGLAVVGVLGAVLITATANLDQLGGSIEDFFINVRSSGEDGSADPARLEYGRGLYLAYLGVAAMGLALYLASPVRHRPDPEGQAGDAYDDQTQVGSPAWAPEDDGDDWPWRPRATARPARSPGGPVDLTVEPATPFLPPGEPDGTR